MRYKQMQWIGLLLLLLWGTSGQAGSTSIVGGYVINNGYYFAGSTTNFEVRAKAPQLGGGVLMNYNLVKGGSGQVELGFLYMPRGFVIHWDNQSETQISQMTLQAPLLLRVSIIPFFSIGVGGYLSYALTNSDNLISLDKGIVGSLAAKFSFRNTIGLLFDLRCQFGLSNLNATPAYSTHFYDIQGLVGVVLGM